ncbi:MAG: imidazole glycerol phosphate synthase subunit HisF [Desulfovibrionaceae bacterium]
MQKIRVIARLDIKNEFVVKGIQLEGLRKLGKPEEFARRYYEAGIDEIIYTDCVASLYDRNSLADIVERTSEFSFIPMTVAGGIRKVADIDILLKAGADKVSINTAAVKRPEFITEASRIIGSQSIVGSIEAKRQGSGWEAYIDNGREHTGLDAVEWARRLEDLGAGELFLTSVDRDGTKRGFDVELARAVYKAVSIPVIVSGGAGKPEDVLPLLEGSGVQAVAFGSMFHYGLGSVSQVKTCMAGHGYPVRMTQ